MGNSGLAGYRGGSRWSHGLARVSEKEIPGYANPVSKAQQTKRARRCRDCKCTNAKACGGGCCWWLPDFCCKCAHKLGLVQAGHACEGF